MGRRVLIPLVFITLAALAACVSQQPSDPQQAFFEGLASLCGARFEGYSSYPEDPGDDFRDKLLVARIEHCSKQQIRIPFRVGENASRTWLINRLEQGLELKHDHRHADGTPDKITLYGGTTLLSGTAHGQSFPADEYTGRLLPDAASNEWFLSLSPDGQQLTYYLERHGAPRFKAVLSRVTQP